MPSFSTKVLATSLLCALAPASVLGATYTNTDNYIGPSFLTGFNHEAIADPTHGRVQYISQSEAQSLNLTYTNANTLILKADSKTVLSASGPGRKSTRLISKKQYSTHASVFEVRHMPVGCGTWPAYWTTSNTVAWPNAGEVDILEGVNDQGPNHSTLHTTSGCLMKANTMTQTGTLKAENCDWQVNGNAGCGVASNKGSSYGPALNAAGGGWFAMERTASTINVWWWAKNEANVPNDVKNPGTTVNPANWGTPYANFVSNNCPLSSKFGPNNYIINLTFCGDWAGNQYVYPASCPQSCVNHVNTNPGAFADAYWDIAALRIYQ